MGWSTSCAAGWTGPDPVSEETVAHPDSGGRWVGGGGVATLTLFLLVGASIALLPPTV